MAARTARASLSASSCTSCCRGRADPQSAVMRTYLERTVAVGVAVLLAASLVVARQSPSTDAHVAAAKAAAGSDFAGVFNRICTEAASSTDPATRPARGA